MAGTLCSSSQQLWDLHHFNPPCLPWPQTGAAAQASRSQHPEPGESHAGSLQGNCSSLPQVLNFPFLATFGCCHSHPGPQLQGQTRRDKARAARSPAATTSNTGVLEQGKGERPSLLFSQIRTWQVSGTWACKAAKAANPRPGLCALPPAHKQRRRAPRHSSPRHTATLSPKAQPQSHPCPVGSRRVDHRRVDHRRRGACSAWGLQSKTTSLEQGYADKTQAQEEHTLTARLDIFCPRCPSSMSFAPGEDEAST